MDAWGTRSGIFKQEMNTLFEENPDVIVVATTNFPQRVDASLIRSGRHAGGHGGCAGRPDQSG